MNNARTPSRGKPGSFLPVALTLALALAACSGNHAADEGAAGPDPVAELSPLEQFRMMGSVVASVQARPGREVRRQEMPVVRAPSAPPRVEAGEVALSPDELVVGLVIEGVAVAYPLRYLNLVEVVNDEVSDVPVAVTWCPLAGTAAVFDRRLEGGLATFHFGTGLIHDSLLLVDEATGSVWSQIARRAIDGALTGERLPVIPSLQTTWSFWRERHPDTRVMVFPGERGHLYHYADFRPDRYPNPPPVRHDSRPLGVGVVADGESWFFPLGELELARPGSLPTLAEGRLRIRHDPRGLVAWVEDTEGRLFESQMAYERAWTAFHPDTRIFRASAAGAGN